MLGISLSRTRHAHANSQGTTEEQQPFPQPPLPESAQDQQAFLERLGALAEAVGTAPTLITVFRALRHFIATSVPANAIFISLYDAPRQERTCVYAWAEGVEEDVSALPPLPMTGSPSSRAVATGQVIVTDDLDMALEGLPRVNVGLDIDPRLPRASVAVPMLVQGRVIGGIEVQCVERASYTPAHVAALRMAANLAAIAIENMAGFDRERQLRVTAERSEQRVRDLLEELDAIVWEADAASLRFTFVSKRAEAILGYPLDRWLSDPTFWHHHVHPNDHERVQQRLRQAANEGEEQEFEYRAAASDGTPVWLHANVRPVSSTTTHAQLLRGLFVDITQRKKAEEALKLLSDAGKGLSTSLNYQETLNNLARLVVPALADYCLVVMMDEGGAVRQIASAHTSPEQEHFTRELERLYPYRLDNSGSIVTRVLLSGRAEWSNDLPPTLPYRFTSDEAVLQVYRALAPRAYLVVPIITQNETIGALVLASSVSGRQYGEVEIALSEELARRAGLAIENSRLYQQAQEAIQTRDQFISIASHDLKTPITSIKGYADLLSRRTSKQVNMNPRDQRAIQVIQDEANRLNRLVELLLDVSRFQRGQLVIERTQIDLCALIKRLVDVTQEMADHHIVTFSCPEPPTLVWCDVLRIEQVIQNLLQNAVKYSPDGGRVTVEVTRTETMAVITVSDQGIGIPQEALDKLFNRFYRADNIQPLSIGGLGLGLYIVRHIVEAHGGAVSVQSELGVGSTFVVELPLDARKEQRG